MHSFIDGTQISITLSVIRDALHRGARRLFSECCLVLMHCETGQMAGWRLQSASSAAHAWFYGVFSFPQTSGCKSCLGPSIVPLTAQCEQIELGIVQLHRQKKRRRFIRKLRDAVSESRSRLLLEDCWWHGTCDAPRRVNTYCIGLGGQTCTNKRIWKMSNCMSVKLRRRVCLSLLANARKPEDVWECL